MSIYMDLYKENEPFFEEVKDKIIEKVKQDLRKYGYCRVFFGCNEKTIVVKRCQDGGDYMEVPFGIAPHIYNFFKREGLDVTMVYWNNEGVKEIKIRY